MNKWKKMNVRKQNNEEHNEWMNEGWENWRKEGRKKK